MVGVAVAVTARLLD